jgi:hypothetical protein
LKTLPSAPMRVLGTPTLVNADGSCAGPPSDEFQGSGIGLQMSECDVVQRAGAPQSIDISANARGDRTAVFTYGGERAGIYRFVSGRLASIEAAPGAAAPERPAKKKSSRTSSAR